jgi:hypothetical protein
MLTQTQRLPSATAVRVYHRSVVGPSLWWCHHALSKVNAVPTALTHNKLSPQRLSRLGLRPCDRTLEAGQEPPLGAHIVTPRRVYTHHGIYAGQGRVLQYGGGLRRGPVEEVSLRRFSHGRQIWIRLGEPGWRNQPDVVHRARSRLGEDDYHVLRNNCEHFCEWCVRGQHRSYQVEALVGRVERGWNLFAAKFARVFTDKRIHRSRARQTSQAHKQAEVYQTLDSRLIRGIVTTELTECTSHPRRSPRRRR